MSSRKKAKQLRTGSGRENEAGRGGGGGGAENSARKLAFCNSNIEENAEARGKGWQSATWVEQTYGNVAIFLGSSTSAKKKKETRQNAAFQLRVYYFVKYIHSIKFEKILHNESLFYA